MSTPFEFMIRQMELNLTSLRWQTAFLESCDWDEEEMERIVEEVVDMIEKLHSRATEDELGSSIVLVALRQKLLTIVREDQIDILMNLLQAETALAAEGGLAEGENGQLGVLQS